MPQSFVSLPVHRVFSTKNREPLIRDEIQTRLYEYMGGILRTQKSTTPLSPFQGDGFRAKRDQGLRASLRDALTPG
ncbi:MAG: hypothetical protein ACYC0X_12540 [Pirellulaceae bacterium]